MTRGWEPGVQYNLGDTVEYHGKRYNIIQPHRSQGDWAPDKTPALWGAVPYHDCDDDYKDKHKHDAHNEDKQCRPPQQWNAPPPPKQRPDQGTSYQPPAQVQAPHQTVKVDEEEQKKSWYDLTPERKKQLAVGGGLAVGLGLLGAGFAAYKHHEKEEEEEKAMVWGAQNWVKEAQSNTQQYYQQGGASGPVHWVLVNGKQYPQDAIVGGEQDGQTLYIARAFHEGGIHVGKAGACCPKGAIIGYDNDEVDYDTYEVLVGDMRGLRWVDVHGKLKLSELGIRPVEGGREKNGTPLYIAQGQYKGQTICGKVSEKLPAAHLPEDDKEHKVDNYRILAYA